MKRIYINFTYFRNHKQFCVTILLNFWAGDLQRSAEANHSQSSIWNLWWNVANRFGFGRHCTPNKEETNENVGSRYSLNRDSIINAEHRDALSCSWRSQNHLRSIWDRITPRSIAVSICPFRDVAVSFRSNRTEIISIEKLLSERPFHSRGLHNLKILFTLRTYPSRSRASNVAAKLSNTDLPLLLALVSNSVHGNRTLKQKERRNTINYNFYLSETDFSIAWERTEEQKIACSNATACAECSFLAAAKWRRSPRRIYNNKSFVPVR